MEMSEMGKWFRALPKIIESSLQLTDKRECDLLTISNRKLIEIE